MSDCSHGNTVQSVKIYFGENVHSLLRVLNDITDRISHFVSQMPFLLELFTNDVCMNLNALPEYTVLSLIVQIQSK